MTTRWEDLRELVAEALELGSEARETLLEGRAGDDPELVREARELLELEERAVQLFAAADRPRGTEHEVRDPLKEGSWIDRWRLVRKLGEGGMGVVWLAQRENSDQRAALKVLHLPLLTASARRRFTIEQRALARLEHPGITRLVDGGVSAEGLPYLATEWVDGPTLNDGCDQRRLGVRERVRLFLEVCAAVQAAHVRLVVHGDIKPSNVLVDANGRVKLCDFGVARLLDSDDDATTRSVVRALTPRYASPEQVLGEPVTTASDVYSLGALLYELLCGAAAHETRTSSSAELRQRICEETPERPSVAATRATPEVLAARSAERAELARALSGDLDAIVMRCLEKHADERYASAAEVADDLTRSLRHEPVRARSHTWLHVLRLWTRRHWRGALLATAAVLALLIGLGAALRQAQLARRAEKREAAASARAHERYVAIRELATSLVFDAHDAIRNLPGSTAARELLAESAARQLDRLAQDTGGDRDLERELARAYLRLGDALGRPVESNLGRTTEALQRYRTAQELADRDASDLALRAWSRTLLADLLLHESRIEEAATLFTEALELREKADENGVMERRADPTLEYLHGQLCELRWRQGDVANAALHSREALARLEQALRDAPTDAVALESLAVGLSQSARIELAQRNLQPALAALERATATIEPLAAATTAAARVQQRAAQIAGEHGQALLRAGQRESAQSRMERAVELHRALLARDPGSASYRDDLAVALRRLGVLLAGADDSERALQRLTEALELARTNRELDRGSAKAARAFAVAADELGGVLARLERDEEALALHAQSRAIFAELAAASPADASAQRGLAVACSMLAQAQLTAARRANVANERRAQLHSDARAGFAQALEIVEALTASGRLPPSDSGVPDFLRRQLAACDGE